VSLSLSIGRNVLRRPVNKQNNIQTVYSSYQTEQKQKTTAFSSKAQDTTASQPNAFLI
jgi:hypothetical protein